MSPTDSGFEMIERDASRPSTTSSMTVQDITYQDISGASDASRWVGGSCSLQLSRIWLEFSCSV